MKLSKLQMQTVNPYRLHEMHTVKTNKARRQDQVNLSSQSKNAAETPSFEAVRQQKIDTLKENIQLGGYDVNKRELAENLLRYYRS